ncbi:precorrin-2 dehydrogenase, sirohydrochlorin ferrochelatase, and uroporphyrinogen III C2,C7-methyltransferase, putative [Syntrophotalea carbinolica DSM 2380]|uniref:uroporphyrinogen-III C-methyltransferase n=1 Tax=Syntrophotalea carbinolica (strain DSM 2380 / NBRC 103641 / GraBd1) TaxID=338963 RepID=Q3A795_SYNC1|nr:uroporphyrinogen-III C-methyltransferase [Syntrophotalea carbinolica]ABA87749.1 precorrin-2 dehydrogenase, sirohydrochlorin ferrochelatase, and uroporphyrinogen III C2,C7-methyltransferase, putative [Syntrophotalea carbinolica DSM 2380]
MHLPIQLAIEGRLCLLVGNGPLVHALIPKLAEHNAHLRHVDPQVTLSQVGPLPDTIEMRQRLYRREDLDGVFLVITDADNPAVNGQVADDARAAGVLIMRGDLPASGDIILPGLKTSLPACSANDTLPVANVANRGLHVSPGKVSLIGAGPGDPGLLTVKGAACLQDADVVLFDAIANPLLVSRYAPQAEKIDVGKRKGNCKSTQENTIRLMLELAHQGRNVARLKGGDPTIFGRGGEEARALFEAGIPFQIVPGVSCVASVPAYAGIPITDREYGSSFGVYTIHKKGGADLSEEQWRRMAQGPDTLILLMGKTMLATIADQLVRQGRPAATPVALITDGTTCRQKRFIGTLATIVEDVERAADGNEGPGLIVVGEVVSAFSSMQWFEPRPGGKYIDATDQETTFTLLSRLMEGIAA